MLPLEHFKSDGREVRVETFLNPDSEEAPSVIVLHGATGVEFANRFIAQLARNFAGEGFAVHLVHYFDRTGSRYADDETIKHSSRDWLTTIHDAFEFVQQRRPNVKIGLFGYSLGGYLAAAETLLNEEVGAAVILAGGLDPETDQIARYAAPVLILHGAADSRVHVSEAQRLEAALRRCGGEPELHIYPTEGHVMSFPAYVDVVERSVSFLRENLR